MDTSEVQSVIGHRSSAAHLELDIKRTDRLIDATSNFLQ